VENKIIDKHCNLARPTNEQNLWLHSPFKNFSIQITNYKEKIKYPNFLKKIFMILKIPRSCPLAKKTSDVFETSDVWEIVGASGPSLLHRWNIGNIIFGFVSPNGIHFG
jgi:hypothetical protein